MSDTKHTPLPWRLGSPNVCCVKKHESRHLGPPDCEYTFQGWNDDDEYFGRFVSSKETQAEIIGSDEDGPMLSLSDAQLIVTSVNAHERLEADSKKLREPATCNAGHKSNLPVALWDCPVCTQLLRDKLQKVEELLAAVNKLKGHLEDSGEYRICRADKEQMGLPDQMTVGQVLCDLEEKAREVEAALGGKAE